MTRTPMWQGGSHQAAGIQNGASADDSLLEGRAVGVGRAHAQAVHEGQAFADVARGPVTEEVIQQTLVGP